MIPRLLPALAAFVLAACGLPGPAAVRWEKDGAVEVAFVRSDDQPRIHVALVDQHGARTKVDLVLDTGSEAVALDGPVVDRLELPWRPRPFLARGFAIGWNLVLVRKLDAIEIEGACRLEDVDLIPIPMPPVAAGVVGLGAFHGRAVVMDAARRRVAFVPRAQVRGLAALNGAATVTAWRRGDLLYVDLELRHGERSATVAMLVDTGSLSSWLPGSTLEELAVARPEKTTIVISGRTYELFQDFELRARLGGVEVKKRFGIDDSHGGMLGQDFLLGLGRPVLFDLEGERIVLLPRGWRP